MGLTNQHRVPGVERVSHKVEETPQIVGQPAKPNTHSKAGSQAKAKAAASKTNPGAVARGDKLVKERPDLAEEVRKGNTKPAEAYQACEDAPQATNGKRGRCWYGR